MISSLWKVPDDETAELMRGFYERLWQGKQDYLEALHGARLDLLRRNRERHGQGLPATWGAFVLDGAWF